MQSRSATPPPWHWPFLSRRLSVAGSVQAALVFAATGLLLRAATGATLGLSDDEAWYWALSRDPSWCYFVHPPLSMWLIRASTAVFGATALAVRLPAIACSALGTLGLVRLACLMGWAKGAHVTAILCLVTPLFFLGGALAGPDAPLFPLWVAMMETSFLIGTGRDQRTTAWLKLGAAIGLAFLAKYTSLLAMAAAITWILSSRAGRRGSRGAGPWLAVPVATLLALPALLWNANHGWESLSGQLVRRHLDASISPARWLAFWGSQFLLLGPALVWGWFAIVACAAQAPRRHGTRLPTSAANARFLAVWALVPGSVLLTQPLLAPFKAHWAFLAFVPALLYFARLEASGTRPRLLHRAIASGAFLAATGMAFLYFPLTSAVAGRSPASPTPNQKDFTNDFHGWRDFRAHLEALPPALAGLPLVCSRYQTASQAAFALGLKARVRFFPDSTFARDWGERPSATPPSAFLFVAESRYEGDRPDELFPAHACQIASRLTGMRGPYAARSVTLWHCARKIFPR